MLPPKEQKFNVTATVKMFTALWDKVRVDFVEQVGQPFDGNFYGWFKDSALHWLGLTAYSFKAEIEFYDDASEVEAFVNQGPVKVPPLLELLSWYYGRPLTEDRLHELCWRMAAGLTHMKKGGSLLKEFSTLGELWSGILVEEIRPGRPSRNGTPQMEVHLRILDGPFAGLPLKQQMGVKWLTGRLAKGIGFPIYQSCDVRELGGCVFIASLDTSNPRFPRVKEFHATAAVLTFNRKLRKLRAEPCSHEKKYKHLCHMCPVGNRRQTEGARDSCYRAVHPRTYVQRACKVCKRPAAELDLELSTDTCVSCLLAASKKWGPMPP